MTDQQKPSTYPAFMTGFSIAVAGAILTILTWVLKTFAHIEPPAEVTQSATFLVAALVGYASHRLNL